MYIHFSSKCKSIKSSFKSSEKLLSRFFNVFKSDSVKLKSSLEIISLIESIYEIFKSLFGLILSPHFRNKDIIEDLFFESWTMILS